MSNETNETLASDGTTKPEFLLPNAKEKRLAKIMLVVLGLFALGLVGFLWYWQGVMHQLIDSDQIPEARRQSKLVFAFIAVTMTLSLFSLSVIIGESNVRARHEQRHPHSKARVLWKTAVLHGAAARRKANFGLLAAVFLLGLSLVSAFWTYLQLRY